MSVDPGPRPLPRYRTARRATAWVLYVAIVLTTFFALFHLVRGTVYLVRSVCSTLAG